MNSLKHNKVIATFLTVVVIYTSFFSGNAFAGGMDDRRIWLGLELFPAFLAADREITTKKGSDGKLLLLLVYNDRKTPAREASRYLQKIEAIRGIPIKTEISPIDALDAYRDKKVAGIFLAQRLEAEINDLIRFANAHSVLVFSPFDGDVERNIMTGMLITDRVLPYVNIAAVQAANIHLKPFFLRIAKQYG